MLIAQQKQELSILLGASALELSKYGIRVNTVSPSLTITPLSLKGWTAKEIEEQKESNPLKRLGETIDINAAVIEDKNGLKGVGISQGFQIPNKYIDEIKATELGKVMNRIFSSQNDLGKGKGGISILTKDEISRIDLTRNACIMALIKFINGDIWK